MTEASATASSPPVVTAPPVVTTPAPEPAPAKRNAKPRDYRVELMLLDDEGDESWVEAQSEGIDDTASGMKWIRENGVADVTYRVIAVHAQATVKIKQVATLE